MNRSVHTILVPVEGEKVWKYGALEILGVPSAVPVGIFLVSLKGDACRTSLEKNSGVEPMAVAAWASALGPSNFWDISTLPSASLRCLTKSATPFAQLCSNNLGKRL